MTTRASLALGLAAGAAVALPAQASPALRVVGKPTVRQVYTGAAPSPRKPKRTIDVTVTFSGRIQSLDVWVGGVHSHGSYLIGARRPAARQTYTQDVRGDISRLRRGRRVTVRVRGCNHGGCATQTSRVVIR